MMLILGCDNKLYLLLHLSSFKKNVGQKVYNCFKPFDYEDSYLNPIREEV